MKPRLECSGYNASSADLQTAQNSSVGVTVETRQQMEVTCLDIISGKGAVVFILKIVDSDVKH